MKMFGKELPGGKSVEVLKKSLQFEIDRSLSCRKYVMSLCKNAGHDLSVCGKIIKLYQLKKRQILIISFIAGQFEHCSFNWIMGEL